LKAYRIADGRYPVFDGTGAELYGARWNSPGRPAIYAGASFAIAMLERLVYSAIGKIPAGSRYVEIEISDKIVLEHVDPENMTGWALEDRIASRRFGDRWLEEQRTAILVVPSAVTRIDSNVVINPRHADFDRLLVSEERPVVWDHRLFARPRA